MRAFRVRYMHVLSMICLFAFCPFVTAQEQAKPGVTTAVIHEDWAIGSIQTTDVTLGRVKTLLGSGASAADAVVCDYSFADIVGDGFYRLLVSIDYSGRHFCNNLKIIANDGKAQDIRVDGVERIADILVKDAGHESLRLPQAFSDYEGARCRAIVPIFYKYSSKGFVPATAEHTDYYQSLRETVALSAPGDVCAQVVVDKVDRLLGDKTAGFSRASTWMTSTDKSLRMKAVWVFRDIDDADSEAALKILATDEDPGIAMVASTAVHE